MSQEAVRDRVKQIIKENGITQTFLCKKTGIPAPIMSLFLNGKKELYPNHLEVLSSYVDNHY